MDVIRLTDPASLNSHEKLKAYEGCSVVIGNFDGVHSGHQELIKVCKSFGQKHVAVTFSPHPEEVFDNNENFFKIFSDEQNYKRFEFFGLDAVVVIPFDKKTLNLTAIQFLEKYILSTLGPKFITVGEDFKFGKGRAGSISFLSKHQESGGYKLNAVKKVSINGLTVSSSAIRAFLREGNVKKANDLLGGDAFFINGEVSVGDKLGQTIGFPTANIKNIKVPLKRGVYKTRVIVGGKEFSGISNFGCRPTVSDKKMNTLETYIFNFSQDIYGRQISIYFDGFIREEVRFSCLEDLKLQIAKDVEAATTKV